MIVGRLARLSITLAILGFYPRLDWADAWQQDGTISVSTEHETNPAMDPTNPAGVWRYMLEPSYKLKRAGDANELNAGVSVQITHSSNTAVSQDHNDPSVFLDGKRQSEAGDFELSAKYDQVATRNAEIDNAGPYLADSTRASRSVSGSWNKALSERSTISADGAYQGVSYTGDSYTDYVTRSGSMMFKYDWSERITPYLRMSYADYEPANADPSSHSANVALGLNWTASDYLDGTLQAGRGGGARSGSQGMASLRYTGQRSGLVLNASRQVSPSGIGGFITIDQVNGSWNYSLGERSKTGIDVGWENSHFAIDTINRSTGIWLQDSLNFSWGLRTYYQQRVSEQSGTGRAYSNILGVALVYTQADF